VTAGPLQAGLFASVKRLLASVLELGSTRLSLISVEIEEQIEYAAGLLLWGIAAILFGSLTVLLLALTILIVFWDTHRLLAAGLITAAFAVIAIVAAVTVRGLLRRRPRFLADSAAELQRDAAALGADTVDHNP
jgi:uncharacterized membrane protein YqjE